MAEGRADRDKNDLKGALKAFAAADAIMHVPTTGLELARAQAAVGQLVEARETALRVARSQETAGEPAPFKAARDAASALTDQLAPRIPSLTVNVKNAPAGATPALTIDGVDVPSEVIGQPRKLDPGHHVVEVKAGTAYGKQEVDVAEKESKEVAIELPAQSTPVATSGASDTGTGETPPTDTEQPVETGGRSGGSKAMIIGGFGLAGAGIIAGSITGIMSMSKTNDIKNNSSACASSGSGTLCNRSVDGDLSTAKTLATISTISFIAGGVGAAVGIIGLFVGGSSSGEPAAAPAQAPDAPPADQSSRLRLHVSPWIGLGSAGLSGTF